jgi:hypothetical protein
MPMTKETPVSVAGCHVEIRTENLPGTSKERYRNSSLLSNTKDVEDNINNNNKKKKNKEEEEEKKK